MNQLNKMLDDSKNVSLEMFLSFNLDTQKEGLELMLSSGDKIEEVFQPWAKLYIKALKHNDISSIHILEDEFKIGLFDTFKTHKELCFL
tara:strand:+ start:139 stop:405 length:267 start_codon:yes stop_codon:yes gene_type:complete